MGASDGSISFLQAALALLVWIAGALLIWWLSRLVEHSVGRGGQMVKIARWARRLTFYGLLLGLLLYCLELAGIPVSLDAVLDRPVTKGEAPLRVSNIVVAVVFFILGLVLSQWASRTAGAALLRRRVDPTAADALQKLVFYVLLAAVALAALQQLQIPVASFAFLGGAVAIGVGFGAQNIINNFISGWILLAERRVRLADLVEVEANLGRVSEIGARCTRLRRMDGIDVLVPNSKLLENIVVNWTLVDDIVRTTVRVGVAYGSPTDKVMAVIRQAVEEQGSVLKEPAPDVIFEEFGDNALIFDAYLWTHANGPMALREVASEVRLRIDALCREAGITIAFPQRDVHLDSLRPVEVRLIGGEARHA